MAIKGGPKIVSDGLVLCLDAHDAKSYAGEPVTNLVTSSAVDFSVMSGYTGNTFSQVVDRESPSGYACEMSYTGTVNSASRSRFGAATNIPTSGTGFVSIWAKRSAGSSTMRPKVYTGYAWYHLEPLDGGSIYFTDEYRPFGVAVTFGTNSGGPNPGFSMTHAGGSTENDKTRWIKPQVTTLSYNTPFANLTRSATNGWVDRTGNSTGGTLTNMIGTEVSHYRDGQVIMPVANSYLEFDGSDAEVIFSQNSAINLSANSPYTLEYWVRFDYLPTTTFVATVMKGSFTTSYGHLFIKNTGDANTTIHVYTDDDSSPELSISRLISTSTWYHIAQTFSSGTAKIYINGELEASTSGLTSTSNTSALRLGSHAGANYFLNGDLAKVNIYNIALTDAQVLSNYNATKGRFS